MHMGTTSTPRIAVPSKPDSETIKATRSSLSTPLFEAESLDKLGTSIGVTTTRSTQQSTRFRNLYSIITPTRPSLSPQVSPSTVDHGLGPSEYLIRPNEAEKELDVEMAHTLFHGKSIPCVKFSRDGKYLAVACFNGKTYIYDVQSGI